MYKALKSRAGLQTEENPNAGFARNPRSKKRMRNHNWDSPRNSLFDVPKLVIAREKSMYLELAPTRDSPNAGRPSPLLSQIFLFFIAVING